MNEKFNLYLSSLDFKYWKGLSIRCRESRFLSVFALLFCLSLIVISFWKPTQIISQTIQVSNISHAFIADDVPPLLWYIRHAQFPLTPFENPKAANLAKIFNQDFEIVPSRPDIFKNNVYLNLKMKIRENGDSLNSFKEIVPLVFDLIKNFEGGNYEKNNLPSIVSKITYQNVGATRTQTFLIYLIFSFLLSGWIAFLCGDKLKIGLAGGLLATSTFLMFPHDISGWFLFYLIFWLMFTMFNPQKIGFKIFTTLFFVIIAHQIISISNAYGMTYMFIQADSVNFQNYAQELSFYYSPLTFLFNFKYDFYARFLALFYVIHNSQLFGQELSILAFFLGCLVLIKIARLLNVQKNIPLLLLVYGLFPSFLVYGSIIIREPWEILFLFLVLYQGILLRTTGTFTWKNVFYFIIFLVGMSLFHKGLFLYTLMFLTYCFFCFLLKFFFFQRKRLFFPANIFIALLIILSLVFCVLHYGSHFITRFIASISHYRTGIMNLKGNFYYAAPLSSTFSWNWLYEVLRAYVYYLFGPFTFKDPSGFLLFIISKIRMIAIFLFLFFYKPANFSEKIIFHTLLFSYFTISLIFALGVSNYGTAIRHHMLTDWILMVLLVPLHGFRKPFSHRMRRRVTQQISSQ